ncbi:uncharacterized protein SPAPADRAFT_67711 [Spathaspora passalidarum NRRL Y-27907]|uniref:Uncharacterized protein n=1 Tax=Spathaspora passalidarum (strain NRRL Y-27907 / 11-Y1) TaxID=619300 RepID=G3AR17_SPAPN|nr:uncharacterized protein SPAPADRAFT_67711 [Spathaspora passalidarum NRRL Y-27907]EGW31678.1 hypothetical protein SPAPADRAFT_67711 [Spathaspora passalidarum NRRL Y-27907]
MVYDDLESSYVFSRSCDTVISTESFQTDIDTTNNIEPLYFQKIQSPRPVSSNLQRNLSVLIEENYQASIVSYYDTRTDYCCSVTTPSPTDCLFSYSDIFWSPSVPPWCMMTTSTLTSDTEESFNYNWFLQAPRFNSEKCELDSALMRQESIIELNHFDSYLRLKSDDGSSLSSNTSIDSFDLGREINDKTRELEKLLDSEPNSPSRCASVDYLLTSPSSFTAIAQHFQLHRYPSSMSSTISDDIFLSKEKSFSAIPFNESMHSEIRKNRFERDQDSLIWLL